MIDYTKFIPYVLAALAIAMAVGWFVMHDKAVADKAVAIDRAAAVETVLAAQTKSLEDKQKVIDYADELSKVRYAENAEAKKNAERYRTAYEKLAADPDVARVLGTRLPESLRQLRRANAAAPGRGDGVPVLYAPGVAAADTGAGAAGRNGGPATRGESPAQPGADFLQRRQEQSPPTDRPPTATSRWWNPLNWFQPARTSP